MAKSSEKKAHEKRIKTLKCKKWNDSDLILRTWTLLLLSCSSSSLFYSPILLSQTAQNIKRLGITGKNVYSIFFWWMGSLLFSLILFRSFDFCCVIVVVIIAIVVVVVVVVSFSCWFGIPLLFDGWTEKFPPLNSIGINFFTFHVYLFDADSFHFRPLPMSIQLFDLGLWRFYDEVKVFANKIRTKERQFWFLLSAGFFPRYLCLLLFVFNSCEIIIFFFTLSSGAHRPTLTHANLQVCVHTQKWHKETDDCCELRYWNRMNKAINKRI